MTATARKMIAILVLALGLLAAPQAALAGFDWDIEQTGSVNDFFIIEAFHTVVTNTGAVADTVMVNMVKDVPGEWVASLCESELCYPPFLLDIELILAPGASTELIIDITPITNQGKGSTYITLVSKNNPADTSAARFSVITPGLDLLYVEAVSGASSEALYADAIAAAGKTHATWTPADMGKVPAADLANFATVIWASGAIPTGLDATDMTNLTAYVTGGGTLLVSGQNLASAYCNPASPWFSTTAHAWFQNSLGTDYVANIGSTDFVTSLISDEIFSGASYNINGGDGSNDNNSPDAITATGNGNTSLSFSGGGTALVRSFKGAGRTVFASFGIEGIADNTSRTDFLAKVLAWFQTTVVAVGDDLQPVLARRAQAWPNPFNPQTSIHFEVGGDRAVSSEVIVYDLGGRAVRHLFQGTVNPGPQRVDWNGRDDSGRHLATGVYLARVQVAQEQQIVKMTLAK